MEPLSLETLRNALIRQEETIIFSLIERAQFKRNAIIYQGDGIPITGFGGCFSDYLLSETEKNHARVRRYTSPDEHSFFADLPSPILPPFAYPETVKPSSVNINSKIHNVYKEKIIPEICSPGDDQHYGSSAMNDVLCLQSLSKRVHYGKFVAEAKFQENPQEMTRLIKEKNHQGLLAAITKKAVEEKLLRRVEQKAKAYGQDIDEDKKQKQHFKIHPSVIQKIYEQWIIPWTKEVEILYLTERLTQR